MIHAARARRVAIVCFCCLLVFSGGCATLGGNGDPRDPLEGMNRKVFSFNEFMDQHLFDPIARVYNEVMPRLVNRSVSNFFSNIDDLAVIANDVLQFKPGQAVSDMARFVFNSTIGIGGLFDVSTRLGLPKHDEDLGQTFAVWGIGSGPYLIAPFLGPMTLRSAAGYGVQTAFLTPVAYIGDDAYRAGVLSLAYVDFRADNLSTSKLIGEAALDKYEFIKNAYFQRRDNLIHDRDGLSNGPGDNDNGPGDNR
jgi:phospholipid-binding lipoprotein MlaA